MLERRVCVAEGRTQSPAGAEQANPEGAGRYAEGVGRVDVPANAPHGFTNASSRPARLLCICSPAGQENFFLAVGAPVATRTEPPPELDEAARAAFIAKSAALAP